MLDAFNKLFVIPERWAYVKDHQLALWLFVGIALQGALGLFIPDFRSGTAISQSLPVWLSYAVYAIFAVGGWSALHGMCRGFPKAEAAGCVLVGTASLIQFASALHFFNLTTLAGATLTFFIAVGCFIKAGQVAEYGRRGTVVVDDSDLEELQGLLEDLKKRNGYDSLSD
jgi:hypothetical protein